LLKETIEKSFDISLTNEGKKLVPSIKNDDQKGISAITAEILNSGKWKNEKFTEIDVSSPVRSYDIGRTHPLTNIFNKNLENFDSTSLYKHINSINKYINDTSDS